MSAVTFPGPKVGFRMGYMGSFGLIGQYSLGTVAVTEVPSIIGMAEYVPHKVAAFSMDISKRIVSFNSFQLHLLAGVHKTTMVFLDPNAMDTPYHDENVLGPEAGFAFGINYFSMSLLAVHIDPGQVEKKGDLGAMSPLNYFTLNLGVRF